MPIPNLIPLAVLYSICFGVIAYKYFPKTHNTLEKVLSKIPLYCLIGFMIAYIQINLMYLVNFVFYNN